MLVMSVQLQLVRQQAAQQQSQVQMPACAASARSWKSSAAIAIAKFLPLEPST